MFQSIYASKLYQASNRKDRIEAAFNDPINSELVGQLAKALDEEYQKPEYLVKDNTSKKVDDSNESSSSNEDGSNNTSIDVDVSGPHFGGSAGSSNSNESSNTESNEDGATSDSSSEESSDSLADTATAEVSNEAVAESTQIQGAQVFGSHPRSIFKDMRQVSDEIKGMLNFKDSTSGVNRILCKENELWIYYNDDVNLNNVMADVIEILNAACYTYLEFNRLARSDNAMVFLVDFADSNNTVQTNLTNKN